MNKSKNLVILIILFLLFCCEKNNNIVSHTIEKKSPINSQKFSSAPETISKNIATLPTMIPSLFPSQIPMENIIVSTLAGSTLGFADGKGSDAKFGCSLGIAEDSSGHIYVADAYNHKIRKITPSGEVSTLAGSTLGFEDGQGSNAKFNNPEGIAVDSLGNIFVADTYNHKIRKITPDGVVSTIAGGNADFANGQGYDAKFWSPSGLALDSSGNLYVADTGNHKIRKITPKGIVSTLAGGNYQGFSDGIGIHASFWAPTGVAVDTLGNVYVADKVNSKIRKITPGGEVSTIAGVFQTGFLDGIASKAEFSNPTSVAVDVYGNVFVADKDNGKIRKINLDGQVSTFAGNKVGFAFGYEDGLASNAKFESPSSLAIEIMSGDVGRFGNIFIADACKIRKIQQ